MEQHTYTHTTSEIEEPKRGDVLCRFSTSQILAFVASDPKPLQQIGFTGIVLLDGVDGDVDSIQQLGLGVHREERLGTSLALKDFFSGARANASQMWSRLVQSPSMSMGADLTSETDGHEAITLLQMSMMPVPIVPVDDFLLYSSSFREQREFLRSAVFWRKRFDIARYTPKLVHAGEDGLLIYTVDSWLICINQNPDEASIDLGSHGSMWLMLGTNRGVHMHGSMLILPAYSGAIVANELAR